MAKKPAAKKVSKAKRPASQTDKELLIGLAVICAALAIVALIVLARRWF